MLARRTKRLARALSVPTMQAMRCGWDADTGVGEKARSEGLYYLSGKHRSTDQGFAIA